MIYLDTSVLVAALTNEGRSDEMLQWLAALPDPPFISHWVTTEFASALSRKVRMRTIREKDRQTIRATFEALAANNLELLTVSSADFMLAASLADRAKIGLGPGDALHLAIAGRHGAQLATLDKPLAKAGSTLGYATMLL